MNIASQNLPCTFSQAIMNIYIFVRLKTNSVSYPKSRIINGTMSDPIYPSN